MHAAWTYDGSSGEGTIYLNGVIDGGPTSQNAPNGGGTFLLGARNNGDGSFNGYLDDVAVWREVLPADQIAALANGSLNPDFTTNTDTDGDG